MKAMIFAAGLGTRLKPFTDKHPKALVPVNGVPVLERNIRYLKFFGINEFVINIHHFADQIIDFVKSKNAFDCTIHFSDESDEVLETGGGLLKASPLLQSDDTILVMNADILTTLNIAELVEFHKANKPLATLAVTGRTSSRQLVFDAENRLRGWQNTQTGETKPANLLLGGLTPKAFSGVQLLSPDFIGLIQRKGKFSIIDEYLDLAKTHSILGFDHSADVLIDVGKPEAIAKAEQFFK